MQRFDYDLNKSIIILDIHVFSRIPLEAIFHGQSEIVLPLDQEFYSADISGKTKV